MHVVISRTMGFCTMSPWITSLEAELTFTKVEHRHGYIPEGEARVNRTRKRLYHVPVETPTEGTFPTGLLPRVLEHLQARGHTHEFRDYRDLARLKPLPDFTKVGLLRPGQDEALLKIAHSDMGIIVAATAFGKSFVITQSCRMYPTLRVLVVTPRVSVVNSLYDRLCKACGADQVGRAGGGKNVLGRRVMVSTTKSLKKVDPSEVDLFFFDEVHGVGDNDVAEAIGYYSDCRRFGFTASPVRGDKSEMCMEALFGRFLVEVSYQEAVEAGNVVPIDVYMVTVPGNIRQSESTTINKRLCYWTNDVRNDIIAKVARKVPEDQQCLIMVETLEHAVHVHKRLPDYTIVHFGAVREDYWAHEWRLLTPAQASRMRGYVKCDDNSYRPATVDDHDAPKYGWICTRKTDKEFREAVQAAGRKVQLLGRLQSYDHLVGRPEDDHNGIEAIEGVETDGLEPGDYYLVKQAEYILDVPKASLKLTASEKEELRKRFESGELKKVIATTTWKEGVDFEQLQNLIRADGATSEVNSTQIPGRLSRLFDGKTHGKLIDFRDECNEWASRRSSSRVRTYRGHGWTIHN